MDNRLRNEAAQRLLRDETIKAAFEAVKESLVQELLKAQSPEDREQKFQEHAAIERVKATLVGWSNSDAIRRKADERHPD